MFSDIQRNTLQEFLAHTFNLVSGELTQQDPLALSIGKDKIILIEGLATSLKLSLIVELEEHAINSTLINLLSLCHFDHQKHTSIRPGFLKPNRACLTSTIEDHDLTIPNLAKLMEAVNQIFTKALNRGSF